MWLVQERRLGRVRALMWSSYASAASILVLASTTRVRALFAFLSLLVLFFSGERKREVAMRLRTTIRLQHIRIAQPITCLTAVCFQVVTITALSWGLSLCTEVDRNRQVPVFARQLFLDHFGLSATEALWEGIVMEACCALARRRP